jgi:hypothetical protein
MAVDSVYVISAVVRSSPTSDKVAIVWLRPIHYDGDPNDPCGLIQWQNDVVYMESSDGGEHWGPRINVSDYTQGGTISIELVPLAYTDVSAVYVGDTLHIVWSTPLKDQESECDPLYASKLWHWDDNNQCISVAFDASYPRFMGSPGKWNNSTCKMNISECDGKLYMLFTRFGAYTSADGDTSIDHSDWWYENGELFVAASSNGGITWGEAHNVTNTFTPDCEAGDCLSEHWSSMAKYSIDNLHIEYIEDHDAGSMTGTEGSPTENPVKYLSYPCFTPETNCEIAVSPAEVGYPTHIAPNDGSTDCTSDITTTFTVTLTNIGTQSTNYTVTANQTWLTPGSSGGTLPAGCDASVDIVYTLGPIAVEGVFDATLTISACEGAFSATIGVRVYVYCDFYLPEYETLSTACWSIGVWNTARAGLGDRTSYGVRWGNMYWFLDEVSFMYDESIIITYDDDTCQTWFSIFDGSDSEVSLVPLGTLTTTSFGTYEYAHAQFANGDTNIVGEIEYYLPSHPDTCVLIERVQVCVGAAAWMTIHIGEAIDWNIPDGQDGSDNRCGYDADRQMLYQMGPLGGPEESYYGGASFCHDIPGGEVSMSDISVYPNGGYDPCWVGGLIARASSFELAPADSVEDLNTVYAVAQNLTLDPDSCYVFCKVKAGSMAGLADLQALMDKGQQWILNHELACPGCGWPPHDPCEGLIIGDANCSGGSPAIDIDDVVYLIAYIFSGGPPPCPYQVASGDSNGDCLVDIDDIVFWIMCIFYECIPPTCEEWIEICGPLQ